MRTLFLFGGYKSNYHELSRGFAEASGGEKAKVALLLQNPESHRYIDGYVSEWTNMGVEDIDSVMPDDNEYFIKNAIETILNSTGIFVGGGLISKYREKYIDTAIKDVIIKRYKENAPYAGLSAGAILVTEKIANYESEDIGIYDGLGILKNIIIMPHFEDSSRKSLLLRFLMGRDVEIGLGIDSSICVKITDEKYAEVYGEGNCFVYRKAAGWKYDMTIFNPGDSFKL